MVLYLVILCRQLRPTFLVSFLALSVSLKECNEDQMLARRDARYESFSPLSIISANYTLKIMTLH